tara:strand:- start:299 stop:409 length:111 start_codon:yes stop_codon:yes gene_type:complete
MKKENIISGNVLTYDDQNGGNNDARIIYTAEARDII